MKASEILELLEQVKKREQDTKEKFNNERIILLRREQIQTNNPAIARVNILFPETLNPFPPEDIRKILDNCRKRFNIEAEPYFRKLSYRKYIVEIKKGSRNMYTWFERFIQAFMDKYSKKYKIRVSGSWDKFDS